MLLIGHIIAFLGPLLFFANPARASWKIETFEGSKCGANGQTKSGNGDSYISQGGNSWAVNDASAAGCWFASWSGINCRGSAAGPFQSRGGYQVPFGWTKMSSGSGPP
jgi:hypothetical protein